MHFYTNISCEYKKNNYNLDYIIYLNLYPDIEITMQRNKIKTTYMC